MNIGSIHERYRELDSQFPSLTPGLATLFLTIFLIMDLRVKPPADSGLVQEYSLGVFLALLQVLPMIFFRRAPLAALSMIFAAFIGHASFDYATPWVIQFSTMIGLYLVTSTTDDRQ